MTPAPLRPYQRPHSNSKYTTYGGITRHRVRQATADIDALNTRRNHLAHEARVMQDEIDTLKRLKVNALIRQEKHQMRKLEETERAINKQIGVEVQHTVNQAAKTDTLNRARMARQALFQRRKQDAADVRQDSQDQLEDLQLRRTEFLNDVKTRRLNNTLDSVDLKRSYSLKMGNRVREARERNIFEMDHLNKERLAREQTVRDLRAEEGALLDVNRDLRELLQKEREGVTKMHLATKNRLQMIDAYKEDFNEQASSHILAPYRNDLGYVNARMCKSIWDRKDAPAPTKNPLMEV